MAPLRQEAKVTQSRYGNMSRKALLSIFLKTLSVRAMSSSKFRITTRAASGFCILKNTGDHNKLSTNWNKKSMIAVCLALCWLSHINATVNYEEIYAIVESEMQQTKKLIETVAYSIIKRIQILDNVTAAKVKIYKLNPPIKGAVQRALVEMRF